MTASTSTQSSVPRWQRYKPDQQWEAYLFLLPSFAGFLIFVAIPVVASLALSFFEWSLLSPPEFVGIKNYKQLLSSDLVFRKVLFNTFYFIVTIVPLQLAFGLLLAVSLNQGLRGLEFYRLIYFMPVVTTIVAAALVFQWFFNYDFGILSAAVWELGAKTGLPSPPAGLAERSRLGQTGSRDPDPVEKYRLYYGHLPGRAAGCADRTVRCRQGGRRQRLATLPLCDLSHGQPHNLLPDGHPDDRRLPALQRSLRHDTGRPGASYAYHRLLYLPAAFEFSRMGKGAAVAWVLFIFIFVFTFVQTRLQRRWVHYEAGGDS